MAVLSADWQHWLHEIDWSHVLRQVWSLASPYLMASVVLSAVAIIFGWCTVQRSVTRATASDLSGHDPGHVQGRDSSPPRADNVELSQRDSVCVDSSLVRGEHEESSKMVEVEDTVAVTDSDGTRCSNARMSSIRNRLLETMTETDIDREQETEAEQLAAIFALMKQNEQKFGTHSMQDLHEQMKFYS